MSPSSAQKSSSTQKIETTGSSEMFVSIHKLCIILEHYNLGIHCHDKLKSNIIISFIK